MDNFKEKLEKAIENENNEDIIKLNKNEIQKRKNDILQKLQIKGDELKKMHRQLKDYRYVSEFTEIHFGRYIRWINLDKRDIKLTNGGILCEININNDNAILVLKNNRNQFMQIDMNTCLIFQKLTDQETLILSVLSYLDK